MGDVGSCLYVRPFLVSQFLMIILHMNRVLPIIWGFYGISLIAETSSMLIAMSDLNLTVIRKLIALSSNFLL